MESTSSRWVGGAWCASDIAAAATATATACSLCWPDHWCMHDYYPCSRCCQRHSATWCSSNSQAGAAAAAADLHAAQGGRRRWGCGAGGAVDCRGVGGSRAQQLCDGWYHDGAGGLRLLRHRHQEARLLRSACREGVRVVKQCGTDAAGASSAKRQLAACTCLLHLHRIAESHALPAHTLQAAHLPRRST